MSADRVALSAHLTLDDGADVAARARAAQRMLARDFGIDHVTLQPSWPVPAPAGRVIRVAPVAGDEPGRAPHRH